MDKKRFVVEKILSFSQIQPDKTALKFFEADYQTSHEINYSELGARIEGLAATLLALPVLKAREQQPIILLFDSSIHYVISFLSVLYSGHIAVTAYPPRNIRHLPRLLKIIDNAKAPLILTTTAIKQYCDAHEFQFPAKLSIVCIDDLPRNSLADHFTPPVLEPQYSAFFQYTSGSTGAPKGVMVSHKNLVANLRLLEKKLGREALEKCVSWLPIFHDMGLIGNTLLPLYTGGTCVFMEPLTFLKNPLFWMQVMSAEHGTYTMAPNFSYDLVAQAAIEQKRPLELDFSHVHILVNVAEPVRKETVKNFEHVFKPYHIKERVLRTGYGMAEVTLYISIEVTKKRFLYVDRNALDQGTIQIVPENSSAAVTMARCGKVADEYTLRIVDPETKKILPPLKVGEIWLKGDSVATGYYKNPEKTQEIFQAYTQEVHEGPFLRTGDLGFLDEENHLIVCGRLKDSIIINGRNIYPQDIEYAAFAAHPSLIKDSAAAFGVSDKTEHCILIAEVEEGLTDAVYEEIMVKVKQDVFAELDVTLQDIVLIPPRKIFKTSSGKIQRSACKQAYINQDLLVLAQWSNRVNSTTSAEHQPEKITSPSPSVTAMAIQDWLKNWIAVRKDLSPESIQSDRAFAEYGLDSVDLVAMISALEEYSGCTLASWLAWEFPTIEQLSEQVQKQNNSPQTESGLEYEPIAVIGMDCCIPGPGGQDLVGIDAFWSSLQQHDDSFGPIPESRWSQDEYYDEKPQQPGKMYVQQGSFLQNVKNFDNNFFNISPKEAEYLDPQQRLMLTTTWRALEDAGITCADLKNSRTGIYMGISTHDYEQLLQQNLPKTSLNTYQATGNSFATAAGRLAYFLGTQGPCMAIDTACSSSLVTIHQACRALHNHECDTALAGGVNLILAPDGHIIFCKSGMLSPHNRCYTFDSRADGYVRGEGCGIVVLKRLSNAVHDGDKIYAVIRGSVVNQDGASNGLTAPNLAAQVALLQETLNVAQLEPEQITHIEAHGTGTALGDPVEWEGIRRAYGVQRETPLYVSSVKTRVGHLEAAAGVTSFIKTVLSLKNAYIPAHLHWQKFNPKLIQEPNMVIPAEGQIWDAPKRYAGVSSFGFSGTNAHLILSNYSAQEKAEEDLRSYHLWVLSAKSARDLDRYLEHYREFVLEKEPEDFAALAHESLAHRTHFAHRAFIVADDYEQWRQALLQSNWQKGVIQQSFTLFWFFPDVSVLHDYRDLFYRTNAFFAQTVDNCCALAQQLYVVDLNVLWQQQDASHEEIYTRLRSFIIEYSLAQWLLHLGLKPDFVQGVGVGEVVAACTAEIISLTDALGIIGRAPARMETITHHEAQIPFILASGEFLQNKLLPQTYWSEPQQNYATNAFPKLCHGKPALMLEVSSAPALADHEANHNIVEGNAWQIWLNILGTCYQWGCTLNWQAVAPYRRSPRAQLLHYPFQNKEYWFTTAADITRPLCDYVEELHWVSQGEVRFAPVAIRSVLLLGDYHATANLFNRTCSKVVNFTLEQWQTEADCTAILPTVKEVIYIERPQASWSMLELSELKKLLQQLIHHAPSLPFRYLASIDSLQGAAMLALLKSIKEEYPNWPVHYVECDCLTKQNDQSLSMLPVTTAWHTKIAQGLLYQQEMVPIVTPAISAGKMSTKGTCLISGGNGDLGQAAIEALIQKGARYIVCLGRRAEPRPWSSSIQKSIQSGIALLYLSGDIANEHALREALTKLPSGYPEIKMVVHAAGITYDKPWLDLTDEEFTEVLATKAQGAWNLHLLSQDWDLEQFISISSLSAVWGNAGQAAYAAANAFLTGLTNLRHKLGLPAQTLILGPVKNMGIFKHNEALLTPLLKNKGVYPITRDEVKQVLQANIAVANLIVCPLDKNVLLKQESTLSPLHTAATPSVDETIMRQIEEVLHLQRGELVLDANWFELGMDSIMATQLMHKINALYPWAELHSKDIFHYHSAEELINRVRQNQPLPEQIADTRSLDEVIVQQIEEVLHLQRGELVLDANWFELGMDSIMATQLMHKINALYPWAELHSKDIFHYHNAQDLIDRVRQKEPLTPCIEEVAQSKAPIYSTLPLSLQQQEIWQYIRQTKEPLAYQIAVELDVQGDLQPQRLADAFNRVLAQHDILRCSFHEIMGQVVQHCHDECTLALEQAARYDEQEVLAFFNQTIDPTKAPLIRTRLIKHENGYRWLVLYHHLLGDGYTLNHVLLEVVGEYDGRARETHREKSYGDFINWQWSNLPQIYDERLRGYWQETLADVTLTVPLAADTGNRRESALISEVLPGQQLHHTLEFIHKNNLSLSNYLLANLFVVLLKRFEQKKLGVVVFFSGRESDEFTEVFGDTSNDVVVTAAQSDALLSMALEIQQQILELHDKQFFRINLLPEIGIDLPMISFDFQREENLGFESTLKIKFIKNGNAQNYLWGSQPRLLSFKILSKERELKLSLKYRCDKISPTLAQSLLTEWKQNLVFQEQAIQKKTHDKITYRPSPLQENLFRLISQHPNGLPYTIILCKELNANINFTQLEQAYNQTLKENAACSVYFTDDQQWMIHEAIAEQKLRHVVVENFYEGVAGLIEEPISYQDAPCAIGYLIQVPKVEKAILLIRFHHLVADGLSAELFFKKLEQNYLQQIEALPILVQSQRMKFINHFLQEQSYYPTLLNDYKNYFAQINPLLPPEQIARPSIKPCYMGSVVFETLTAEASSAVIRFCQLHDISTYTFYCYVFSHTLSHLLNQSTLYISLVKSNRGKLDDPEMIGYFADNIPVIIELKKSLSFTENMQQIQNQVLDLVERFPYTIRDSDRDAFGYQRPKYLFNQYTTDDSSKIIRSADYMARGLLALSDNRVDMWNYANPEQYNLLIRSKKSGDMLFLIFDPEQARETEAEDFMALFIKNVLSLIEPNKG